MPVTLTGEARAIAAQMAAVSPCTDVAAATWRMGDTLPAGDDVAATQVAVGPGFTGSLSMDLVSPASSSGTSSVKMFRRYLDKAGNLLSQADSAAISVIAGTPVTTVLPLTVAPAGTAACEVGIYSNMAPPGNPTRTNEFISPRAGQAGGPAIWSARNGWTLGTGSGGAVVAGVATWVRVQAVAAGAAADCGFGIYGGTSTASPAGTGAPAVPGSTMTLSLYMWSSKAGTATLDIRPFAGAAWSAAATTASVAIAASTWTRVAVTLTVPAGATQLAATARISSSPTWAVGDSILATAVLLEEAASAGLYFDGTSQDAAIAAPKASRWESAVNASRSIFYPATKAGGTTVQATDAVMSYGATVEELIGAALERPLRRSVADIWNAAQTLITGGTPGLLQGQLTYLCASLAHAQSLDAVYAQSGLVVLDSTDELDGLTHRAVGLARMTPERALPGKAAKWLYVVDFREQVL